MGHLFLFILVHVTLRLYAGEGVGVMRWIKVGVGGQRGCSDGVGGVYSGSVGGCV